MALRFLRRTLPFIRDDRGFSVLEVVIASALFALLLVPLILAVNSGVNFSGKAGEVDDGLRARRLTADFLAQHLSAAEPPLREAYDNQIEWAEYAQGKRRYYRIWRDCGQNVIYSSRRDVEINPIVNPSFEYGTAGWSATNGAALSRSTTTGVFRGTQSLVLTTPAVGRYAAVSEPIRVAVGDVVRSAATITGPQAGYAQLEWRFEDKEGRGLVSGFSNEIRGSDGPQRVELTSTPAPTDAVRVRIRLALRSTSSAAPVQSATLDGVIVATGIASLDYFDGDSADAGWAGDDPGQAVSLRGDGHAEAFPAPLTPTTDRSGQLLVLAEDAGDCTKPLFRYLNADGEVLPATTIEEMATRQMDTVYVEVNSPGLGDPINVALWPVAFTLRETLGRSTQIANGGFEEQLSGWQTSTGGGAPAPAVVVDAFAGVGAILLRSDNSTQSATAQRSISSYGDALTVWVKAMNPGATPICQVDVLSGGVSVKNYPKQIAVRGDQWRRLTLDDIPEGEATLRLQLLPGGSGSGARGCLFDALRSGQDVTRVDRYAAAVAGADPVLQLRFNNSNPNTILDYATKRSFSLSNITPAQASDFNRDPRNRSAGFNGTDSQITINDSFRYDGGSEFTLEAVVRPTALGGTTRMIVNKGAGSSMSYQLFIDDNGRPAFRIGNTTVSAPESVVVNQWYYIVGTYDGEAMRLFVDGVEVANSARIGTVPRIIGSAVIIGANASGGDDFQGQIDELALYRSALSAARVAKHYTEAGRE